MGFHEDAIFPTNISYGSRGGPGFSTSVIVMDSGQEERVARWTSPKHRYDASYGIRSFDDLMTVKEFYIARLGPAYGFKWFDWLDFSSAANGRDAPDDEDVLIGSGDGTEVNFQLIKNYTSGGITRTRLIIKPISGTVVVALDGVAKTEGTDYTINYTTGIVTFTAAPGAGVEVTAGFKFYVPVRFGKAIDEVFDCSIDSFDSGSIDAIPIVEDKDPGSIADEFYYGGAYDHGNITANIAITHGQGRVHTLAPVSSGLTVTLPNYSNLPAGGPHFYIVNEGTYQVDIKDHIGGTVIQLPSSGVAVLIITINAVSQKAWFAK